jgi:hypothetical protein
MKKLGVHKNYFIFLLFIPAINVLADSLMLFFEPRGINPGTVRAFIIGIYTLMFIKNFYPKKQIFVFVLIYLAYFFLLTLSSSNFSKSFYEYLKLFLPTILLPIAYMLVKSKENYNKLINAFTFALILLIVNIIISNIFKLGTSDYLDESFYFGAQRVNVTKEILMLSFIIPVAYMQQSGFTKRLLGLIFIMGVLIAIIGIKRSVLFSGVAALIIYLYSSPFKGNISKVLIVGAISLFAIIPFYLNTFLLRIEARERQLQFTEEAIEVQARYNEINMVLDAWKSGSLRHKLFGSEIFNDQYFFKTNRILHIDYMKLLNGSGIVGMFFWFALFFLIYKEKNKYYKYLKNIQFYREVNTIFLILIASQLLISISGSIASITLRSIFFIYWGATIGLMRAEAYNQINLVKENGEKSTYEF